MGEKAGCRQLGADGGWSTGYDWGDVELDGNVTIRAHTAHEGGESVS